MLECFGLVYSSSGSEVGEPLGRVVAVVIILLSDGPDGLKHIVNGLSGSGGGGGGWGWNVLSGQRRLSEPGRWFSFPLPLNMCRRHAVPSKT